MDKKQYAFVTIAKDLRSFGYPDVTTKMIEETYDAMVAGKSGKDLPHGIVSMFAENKILDVAEHFPDLPTERE